MIKYRGNPWVVLIVVSLGFFMTLLDLTIVNIAIPNMIAKLHASLDGILWVINAYALVLAVLLVTAGRLGDLRGQRKLFIIGVALFTAASAACGFSPTVGWLIGFRTVQGVGAALLMPQTLAILTMVFPAERRGAAFGIWGAVAGVATIAGPTLGGLLVTAFDWRYIFFINVPIGLAVIALGVFMIPDLRTGTEHRLDVAGVVLASLALLAICYGLVEGQKYNWGKITSIISIPLVIGVGVVLLGVFLFVQARTQAQEPLIPFSMFRDRNFSLMNWMSGAIAIGMMGIFLPLTIYLQSALGFSALKAGLAMSPASLVSMFVAPVAGRLTDRIGGKFILFTGVLMFAGGMGWLAAIASPHSTWPDFLPPLAVAGFGMGCTFAPMTTTAMRSVQPRLAGAASAMINTTRQVGAVIGTAAIGALLQNRLTAALPAAAQARDGVLPPQARAQFVAGFARVAQSGAAVGQGGSHFKLPPGTPPSVVATIGRIAREAFSFGYVTAMHQTMIMPIAVLGVAAFSCLAIKRVVADGRQAPLGRTAAGGLSGASVTPSRSLAIEPGGAAPIEPRRGLHLDAHQGGQVRPPQPVIAVDAMGGDHAPGEIVAGAVDAFRTWGTRIVLIGKPGQVRPLLAKHGLLGEIRLVTAEDSVAMSEGALTSWRRPRSSIAVACQLVHLGQATAVMSAGSTGAIVAVARLRLRNLPGVIRPALAVPLPTRPTPTLLIDAGAIADPKPEVLVQFAQLGAAYAEVAYGIIKPRIGLLSIGAEPGKGNKLARRAYELLIAEPTHGAMPISFVGNVEGGDLLAGKVDVVVTDGFSGNIALKTLEGTAAFTAAQFRSALGGSRGARLGAMLARKELRELRSRFDPETYGGAALLGLEGTVVIAHGSSTQRGAASACKLAGEITSAQITERIKERLGPHRQGHFLRRSDRH